MKETEDDFPLKAACLSIALLLLTTSVHAEDSSSSGASGPPRSSSTATRPRPIPASAEPLLMGELFRRPVGPRGLEPSDKAKHLAGRRVSMSGYMVRQTAPTPYTLLLTPIPVQMHEREYGLADDLPPGTVQVHFPKGPQPLVPHVAGVIEVEGILELGPVESPDGRITHVRIRVDQPWMGFRRPQSAQAGPPSRPLARNPAGGTRQPSTLDRPL